MFDNHLPPTGVTTGNRPSPSRGKTANLTVCLSVVFALSLTMTACSKDDENPTNPEPLAGAGGGTEPLDTAGTTGLPPPGATHLEAKLEAHLEAIGGEIGGQPGGQPAGQAGTGPIVFPVGGAPGPAAPERPTCGPVERPQGQSLQLGFEGINLAANCWRLTRLSPILGDIAHGPEGFVAEGGNGLLLTSTDGLAWRPLPTPTVAGPDDTSIVDMTVFQGAYWAALSNGRVAKSDTALDAWVSIPGPEIPGAEYTSAFRGRTGSRDLDLVPIFLRAVDDKTLNLIARDDFYDEVFSYHLGSDGMWQRVQSPNCREGFTRERDANDKWVAFTCFREEGESLVMSQDGATWSTILFPTPGDFVNVMVVDDSILTMGDAINGDTATLGKSETPTDIKSWQRYTVSDDLFFSETRADGPSLEGTLALARPWSLPLTL